MPLNLKPKLAILASDQPQRQAATTCGVRENRFSEIVHGWTEARDDERQATAQALRSPADELFDAEEGAVRLDPR